MNSLNLSANTPTRRSFLTGTAALASVAAVSTRAKAIPSRRADYMDVRENGTLQIFALTDRAFRVRFSPGTAPLTAAPDRILLPQEQQPRARTQAANGKVRLRLPGIICDLDPADGHLSFLDGKSNALVSELPDGGVSKPRNWVTNMSLSPNRRSIRRQMNASSAPAVFRMARSISASFRAA